MWDVTGPFVLVALLSLAWALAEIVQTFASDVRRALRTTWAWFFVGAHVIVSLFVYVLVRAFFSPSDSPWRLALVAGLGWQVLLRTRANLIQPINGSAEGGVPFWALADLYNRFQHFCRTQIDQALVVERMRLLEMALRLPPEELERQMNLHQYASMTGDARRLEEFMHKLRQQPDERRRKLLMASYLLQTGGYDFFRAWVQRRTDGDR